MTIAPPGRATGNALIIDNAQLIGGDWVPAAGGQSIDVINPADGEVLARVPRGTANPVIARFIECHAAESARHQHQASHQRVLPRRQQCISQSWERVFDIDEG